MKPARYFTTSIISIVILIGLLIASGCSRKTGPTDIELGHSLYEPAYDPDALVSNFVLAWENMDLEAYGDLVLYDGMRAAADGGVYEPFIFYRDDYPRVATSWQGYGEELDNVGRMFSGKPGRGGEVPGIESIDVEMLRRGEWSELAGERVHGHVFPPGTQRCVYDCELFVKLKNPYKAKGRSEVVNGFTVSQQQEFFVIPVEATGATLEQPEYRLWKWHELPKGMRVVD
jgi:hypothetical protein